MAGWLAQLPVLSVSSICGGGVSQAIGNKLSVHASLKRVDTL